MQEPCANCPLTCPYVPADGHRSASVMVVGTSPGPSEEIVDAPFAGPAGEIVRHALGAIVGDDVFYTNVIPRRTDKKPTKEQLNKCGKHLLNQIEIVRPMVIVTLGSVPTRFILGHGSSPLKEVHGLMIPTNRFGREFFTLPTYDPSFVLRRGGLTSATGHQWLTDLEELKNL